ncbi:MAG: hypothetical protein OXE95_01925 [Chloroflexi bacterium]|nr:hypothetical protein [Chloroflexota bacterium]MCY4246319.1 hypothetical protein [Chloroflexota bacterium]
MERTYQVLRVDDCMYAARHSGLWRIDPDGAQRNLFANWRAANDTPALCVATKGDTLLAGVQGGVARSFDGGDNWEVCAFRLPAPLVTCLCLGADCLLAGTFADGVFRSTDAGATWQAYNHGLFDHSVNCLALSPRFADDGAVYAGTSTGIYCSHNGGRLWQDMHVGSGRENVLCLAAAEDGALYAGCEAHGLLRIAAARVEPIEVGAGAVNGLALTAAGLAVQLDDRVVASQHAGASWRTLADGVDCLALAGDALLLGMADGQIVTVPAADDLWKQDNGLLKG